MGEAPDQGRLCLLPLRRLLLPPLFMDFWENQPEVTGNKLL